MSPIDNFNTAWDRCDHLSILHGYIAANVTGALKPDELLRSEWAARVSALDLYIHELISQRISDVFCGVRPQSQGFSKFQISASSILLAAASPTGYFGNLDLEVRTKLERRTFQYPADIADAVRYISDVELWNDVALLDGATEQTKINHAKTIKNQLTQIVNRRNKIVHEADLQPGALRIPWPITSADVNTVKLFLEKIVRFIDMIV